MTKSKRGMKMRIRENLNDRPNAVILVGVLLLVFSYGSSHATVIRVPAEHPTFQAAINASNHADIVLVAPGTYEGEGNRDIDFKGKAITVKSEQGPESCIIQCGGVLPYNGPGPRIEPEYHRGFYFHCQEDANSVVQGFTVTGGYMGFDAGGAILCNESSPTIRDCIIVANNARNGGGISAYQSESSIQNCIIKGNHASESGGGIFCTDDGDCQFVNCTVSGNKTGESGIGGGILFGFSGMSLLKSSIVWQNTSGRGGNEIALLVGQPPTMLVQVEDSLFGNEPNDIRDLDGSLLGEWLTEDPRFAFPGYWDLNGTPNNPNDDFWIDGDYHLQSQAGRWDPISQTWIQDDVTSPCIDSGDPNSPIGHEPFPNGGIINIGAYGGTAEASKSYFGEPICETIVAGDINGDCKVDLIDISLLLRHWLYGHPPDQQEPGIEPNDPSIPDLGTPER